MDKQKRMLATALRDLAGPHEGMVYTAADSPGPLNRGVMSEEKARWAVPQIEWWLPDPDAPANWGVWLAWSAERVHMLSVAALADGWRFSFPGPEQPVGPYASGLLRAVVVVWLDTPERGPLPTSVTAWWESEQGGAP